jgi:hypothetical protein
LKADKHLFLLAFLAFIAKTLIFGKVGQSDYPSGFHLELFWLFPSRFLGQQGNTGA